MDWSNERYVRLYTRDTTTWKLLSWQARCVFALLLRKVDRAGVIDVADTGIEGLAAMLEIPLEIVEVGARDLLKRGTLAQTEQCFVLPNFIEAQETRQSDPMRARESRERRRNEKLRNTTPPIASPSVTKRHQASPAVTPSEPSDPSPDQTSDPARSLGDGPPGELPEDLHLFTEHAPPLAKTANEIRSRGRLAERGLDSLNAIRARVANKFGWTDVRPLPLMDRCVRDLQERLSEAGPAGEEQLAKVLRIAELEAVAKRTVEYLGGGIFTERSWSKKLAMRESDAMRSIGARGTEPPEPIRINRGDDDPPPIGRGGS